MSLLRIVSQELLSVTSTVRILTGARFKHKGKAKSPETKEKPFGDASAASKPVAEKVTEPLQESTHKVEGKAPPKEKPAKAKKSKGK
ncbi:hypothetical protein QR680_014481 [Steinernema hermaphroditum]|uniref:Uncharacterized protein n=1 Tax=Steinernema hermaphroditum TaxID=289476 RepID=A0AA39M390_9BILA|nr:hypothetical protein QR680_014481 [Steinernema hermaphroditum]